MPKTLAPARHDEQVAGVVPRRQRLVGHRSDTDQRVVHAQAAGERADARQIVALAHEHVTRVRPLGEDRRQRAHDQVVPLVAFAGGVPGDRQQDRSPADAEAPAHLRPGAGLKAVADRARHDQGPLRRPRIEGGQLARRVAADGHQPVRRGHGCPVRPASEAPDLDAVEPDHVADPEQPLGDPGQGGEARVADHHQVGAPLDQRAREGPRVPESTRARRRAAGQEAHAAGRAGRRGRRPRGNLPVVVEQDAVLRPRADARHGAQRLVVDGLDAAGRAEQLRKQIEAVAHPLAGRKLPRAAVRTGNAAAMFRSRIHA